MSGKQEFMYIYNLRQSLYFIQSGLMPIEIYKGKKGDVYHKFHRDYKCERVFDKWSKLSK